MWIGSLGATPQGQVGHLVNEILRTLAFDISLKLQDMELTEESMPEVVGQLKHLSLVAMRLEKAASENVKREAEIREQAKLEAAAAAEKVAKKGGLSTESVQELRRAILGVRP
jgi:HD-GYP domain-containing protein (c-di-GMP phosphodiesterase class II)